MTQHSMAQRANQAYRGAAVAVPPLKAVVMLHAGAITQLRRAIEAQEARRFEEGHECVVRATAILRGLSHYLDSGRGGALAERLFNTYNALVLAALRASGRPHVGANLQRIIDGIAELREAWEFVETTARTAAPTASRRAE